MPAEKPELSGLNQDQQVIVDLHEKALKVKQELLVKNIYRKRVFDKLVGIANDIDKISAQTRLSFDEVVQLADIEDPYQTLLDSMRHWDRILSTDEILSERQLIDRLRRDFQLDVRDVTGVVVPPDQLESSMGDGEGKHEKGDDFNRVGMVIETLLHNSLGDDKIYVEDLDVSVGKMPVSGFRERPYWIINLSKFKIAVFVNNQYGNRTFVLKYKDDTDLEGFSAMTKMQLKAESDKVGVVINHFLFENEGQFKATLLDSVRAAFEGRALHKHYASYEEARAAARSLGIRTRSEYSERYKEDIRLPSSPREKYKDEWISWNEFLTGDKSMFDRAKEIYQTISDAKEATKRLNIITADEYQKRYREDKRLPASPREKYKDEWISWIDFLGTGLISSKERTKEIYSNIAEAKEAVRKLGIKAYTEYRKRYNEDKRLPSGPDLKYKDEWISWSDFLENGLKSSKERTKEIYKSIAEAKEAVNRLGITTVDEYRKRYSEDKRLPSVPNDKYKDEWISWINFLGK
ncbi:hypothetical protein IT412_02825 [Candidatus Peregrinibacteria bacterium]|nr:hypothetical protein [Candidatus Peregrinibacteria bacterium]